MKKLIKLQDKFLLVNDEEIKEGDKIYCDLYSLDSYKQNAVSHIILPRIDVCKKISGLDGMRITMLPMPNMEQGQPKITNNSIKITKIL